MAEVYEYTITSSLPLGIVVDPQIGHLSVAAYGEHYELSAGRAITKTTHNHDHTLTLARKSDRPNLKLVK